MRFGGIHEAIGFSLPPLCKQRAQDIDMSLLIVGQKHETSAQRIETLHAITWKQRREPCKPLHLPAREPGAFGCNPMIEARTPIQGQTFEQLSSRPTEQALQA